MKMKRFDNRNEEESMINFLKKDGIDIKIKFITDTDYDTRIYYDDLKEKNIVSGEVFGSSMFNMRQSNFQITPIIQRNRQAVAADNNSLYPWCN
jgi:hypothetical protein